MQGFLSRNILLGRIGGLQVRVHLLFGLFFAIAALALLRDPHEAWWWVALAGTWTVNVLLHEVAHYLSAHRHGGAPHEVVLWPLGGLVQFSVPRSPAAEFAVALAGPLASALLAAAGGVALYSQSMPDPEGAAQSWLAFFFQPPPEIGVRTGLGVIRMATWVNGWLAVLNLVPAVPLDGARAGRALLWSFVGYRRAGRWMRRVALAAAAAVCLGPALLRADRLAVSSAVEVPLVALGVLLFFFAQNEPVRGRKRAEDESPEQEEWRVTGALAVTGDPFASGDTPLEPAAVGQAIEARLEERLHRQQQEEEEEDRRVDEILTRLHVAGPTALSTEDQALLERVSARLRGRKSK
jgi:Zn-dependent protease